jgi:hypothetical protein
MLSVQPTVRTANGGEWQGVSITISLLWTTCSCSWLTRSVLRRRGGVRGRHDEGEEKDNGVFERCEHDYFRRKFVLELPESSGRRRFGIDFIPQWRTLLPSINQVVIESKATKKH